MGDKVEIVGIMNGYDGLINGNYREMSPDEFSGIPDRGRHHPGHQAHPFKKMRVVEDDKVDKVAAMKKKLPRRQAGLPALPRRQRHPQDREPAQPGRAEHHRPA